MKGADFQSCKKTATVDVNDHSAVNKYFCTMEYYSCYCLPCSCHEGCFTHGGLCINVELNIET